MRFCSELVLACQDICHSMGLPYAKWASSISTASVLKLAPQVLEHDQYILVSGPPLDLVVPDLQLLTVPTECDFLLPVLATRATMLIRSPGPYRVPQNGADFQAAASILMARRLPVFDAYRSKLAPLMKSLVFDYPTVGGVLSVLNQLAPISRFPFSMCNVDGTWRFLPQAPIEYMIDAPEGSPMHTYVAYKVAAMAMRGIQKNVIREGPRYYARFLGDICVAIEDQHKTEVLSILSAGPIPDVPTAFSN